MTKLFYRPSDLKLVHSVNGWPTPTRYPSADAGLCWDQYEKEAAEYKAALIEDAVPLEDQDKAKLYIAENLFGDYHKKKSIGLVNHLFEPGSFYEIKEEVEIVLLTNKNDILDSNNSAQQVARIKPSVEQKIVPQEVIDRVGNQLENINERYEAPQKYKHANDHWLKERLTAKKKYRDNARRNGIEKLIAKIEGYDKSIIELEQEIKRRENGK